MPVGSDDFEGKSSDHLRNSDVAETISLAGLVRHTRLAICGSEADMEELLYDSTVPRPLAVTLALVEAFLGESYNLCSLAERKLLEDPNLNDDHVIGALILTLSHEEEDVGSEAIHILDKVTRPDIEDILTQAYQDATTPIHRIQLLWALHRFDSEKTAALLAEVLTTPEYSYEPVRLSDLDLPQLRSSYTPALRFLLDINTPEARAAILNFLEQHPNFKGEFLNHFLDPGNQFKLPSFLEQSRVFSSSVHEMVQEAMTLVSEASEAK